MHFKHGNEWLSRLTYSMYMKSSKARTLDEVPKENNRTRSVKRGLIAYSPEKQSKELDKDYGGHFAQIDLNSMVLK